MAPRHTTHEQPGKQEPRQPGQYDQGFPNTEAGRKKRQREQSEQGKKIEEQGTLHENALAYAQHDFIARREFQRR